MENLVKVHHIHSAKEIVVLMYILYLERHAVEIIHRIDIFYSGYNFLPLFYVENMKISFYVKSLHNFNFF